MHSTSTENLGSNSSYQFSAICYMRLLLQFVQQPTSQKHWTIYCGMFLNYLFWVVMHLIYCSKNCQSSLLWFCIYLSQTLFFTYSSSVDGFSFLFSIRFCPVCLSSQILLIFSHTYLVPLFESRQWISCLFLLQV